MNHESAPARRTRANRATRAQGKIAAQYDALDQSGEAIVALLQQAATLSNENCDRAMSLAHKLSIQLRAAEDRIKQLQAELAQSQDRSARAEKWLSRIYQEIEQKLISPRANSQQAARH